MSALPAIEDVFLPLQNRVCWGCKRGHGTFITIEFGNPHLRIREPISNLENQHSKIIRQLSRRRVNIVGDWHLWIESASWELIVDEFQFISKNFDENQLDCALEALSGQYLMNVTFDLSTSVSEWLFDRGGRLSAGPNPEPDGDIWSLFQIDGTIVTCREDGNLVLGGNAPVS